MTIHYIIYILLLLLFLPFHYWCDWFMRTRNIDLRYMFIIVMCAFGVVATWTYMYECTCTYKMLRLCSQWRVSTLLYSFVIRNWRIGFICSDIIILRCMNVTNKANMCFAYGQSVLTSSRWRRLFGCCCCCGGFFFFCSFICTLSDLRCLPFDWRSQSKRNIYIYMLIEHFGMAHHKHSLPISRSLPHYTIFLFRRRVRFKWLKLYKRLFCSILECLLPIWRRTGILRKQACAASALQMRATARCTDEAQRIKSIKM